MVTSAVRLLVSVGFLSAFAHGAFAMTPEKATELLARAQAADQKCNILKVSDKDELSMIVAEAEIALAESTNVEVTKAALAKGRSAGASVACDKTTKNAVIGVYESARGALGASSIRKNADTSSAGQFDRDEDEQDNASARQEKFVTASTSAPKPKATTKEKEVVVVEKKQVAKTTAALAAAEKVMPKPTSPLVTKQVAAKTFEKKTATETAAKSKADKKFIALSSYGTMAEKYYVELRCRKMTKASIQKFYGEVISTHKQAVATHGKPAVKKLLSKAEARADQASCG